MRIKAKQVVVAYTTAATVFFLVDVAWIGLVANTFYANTIGGMLAEQITWSAAMIFYLIYISGILIFVLVPAMRDDWVLMKVALMSGCLGIFAYGTFDLTSLALFRGWSIVVTIVDMVWGAFLTMSTATITFWIVHKGLKFR